VPRRPVDDVPEDVKAVAAALLELSYKEGLTRAKLIRSPVMLALTSSRYPSAEPPEQARRAEEMIRLHVNSIRNLRDRVILAAALNLDQEPGTSFEDRINRACDSTIGGDSPHFITPDGAQGRFRYVLTVDLALRLLGGSPAYAMPRPPSDDLELAVRLQRSHQTDSAVQVLKRVTDADEKADRRHAWRLLATIAYESGDYDGAEIAFDMALRNAVGMRRGGKLTVAIDRYARRLTEEEDYDRALAIVSKGIIVVFESLWLWRRYGCIKWYAGELVDAYAALTIALDLGYSASRVFHARGQVLAELGRYNEAIEQLTEALRVPRSPVSQAEAISARAFAVGMSGNLDEALDGFREAEQVISFSSWLHYWRGLCFYHHDKPAEALMNLVLAVGPETAPLNRPKRLNAERVILELTG
jgi:tetratricopeptide (TPR) repeat protein